MRYRGWALAGGLLALWVAFGGALLAKGGLYLAKHEGDAMHLVEIALRQAGGGWPHLDFMTPIGMAAGAPIALFVALGYGVGVSILAAQVLVAALLLPALWWVGVSRMGLGWGLLFGAVALALCTAVVHGEAEPSLSISMHYNRWAWAISFVALAVAVLPSARRAQGADGAILGLAVAALALIKVTYAAAFLPPILLALALRRQGRALVAALVAGLAVILVVTVWAGPGIWPAYIGDLLATARSEIRSNPGASFAGVVVLPAYLGGSLVALGGVMLLRQAGRDTEGLLLLTLLPGFFYVAFQNYGNDPQWLYLVGILLLVLRPEAGVTNGLGWDMRQALALAGLAAFTLGLPSAINIAWSPFRHLTMPAALYGPLFPRAERHGDIFFVTQRSGRVLGRAPLPGFALPDTEPALLNGAALPECQLDQGTVPIFDAMARRLEEMGQAGRPILTADLFSSLWLFGDLPPLPGGAPWYYGGLPGGEAAELVLVPDCPILPRARRAVLEEIAARGWTLREVARDPVFRLMEIQRPESAARTR